MRTIESLRKELTALPDPLDVSGSPREVVAIEGRRSALNNAIHVIGVSATTLAEWRPRLDADVAYLDALNRVLQALNDELLALARPRTDHEWGVLANVKLSIVAIHRGVGIIDGTGWELSTIRLGKLLTEAGIEWCGSLPEVERRIREAQRRCDDAQTRLDAAQLDDAERAQRDGKLAATS